jgi:uncharacterized protein YkwD
VRTRIAICAAVAAGLLGAGAPVSGAATLSERNALESRVVARINAVRTNHGLRPVRVVSRLATAADRHARSMAAQAYFRHELFTPSREPDWTSFGRWIRWYYPGPGYSSWSAGENLAWGTPDLSARETVKRWLQSPPHRANLLAPGWRNLGVAAVHVASPTGYYGAWDEVTIVVADFGRRS